MHWLQNKKLKRKPPRKNWRKQPKPKDWPKEAAERAKAEHQRAEQERLAKEQAKKALAEKVKAEREKAEKEKANLADASIKPEDTLNMSDPVTVCHIPPGNPMNARTLKINRSALKAHLAHGDSEGICDMRKITGSDGKK